MILFLLADDRALFIDNGRPAGVLFDTPAQIKARADRILERAVISKTMPFGNKTGMTDEERALLGRWVEQGANVE